MPPQDDNSGLHALAELQLNGAEARLQRVEATAAQTAIETVRNSERVQALTQRIEDGFERVHGELGEVMDAIRPVGVALNDPEHGLVVRVSRLEDQAREAREARRRRWVLVGKVTVPVVVAAILAALGLHGVP